MVAESAGFEMTYDTQCMGTFSTEKDPNADSDELYPFKITYTPSSSLNKII